MTYDIPGFLKVRVNKERNSRLWGCGYPITAGWSGEAWDLPLPPITVSNWGPTDLAPGIMSDKFKRDRDEWP